MTCTYANFRNNWVEHNVNVEDEYNSVINSVTLCKLFVLDNGMNPRTKPLKTFANDTPSVNKFLKITRDTTKLTGERTMSHNYLIAKLENKTRKHHQFKVRENVLISTKNISLRDGARKRKLNPRF